MLSIHKVDDEEIKWFQIKKELIYLSHLSDAMVELSTSSC